MVKNPSFESKIRRNTDGTFADQNKTRPTAIKTTANPRTPRDLQQYCIRINHRLRSQAQTLEDLQDEPYYYTPAGNISFDDFTTTVDDQGIETDRYLIATNGTDEERQKLIEHWNDPETLAEGRQAIEQEGRNTEAGIAFASSEDAPLWKTTDIPHVEHTASQSSIEGVLRSPKPDRTDLYAIAGNPNLNERQQQQLLDRINLRTTTGRDLLTRLAANPKIAPHVADIIIDRATGKRGENALQRLAANPHAGPGALWRLSQKKDTEILSALAVNPGADDETTANAVLQTNTPLIHDKALNPEKWGSKKTPGPTTLDTIYTKTTDPYTKADVLRHPNVPTTTIDEAFSTGNRREWAAIAANPALDTQRSMKLLQTWNPDVIRALAAHNTHREVLRELRDYDDPRTQKALTFNVHYRTDAGERH